MNSFFSEPDRRSIHRPSPEGLKIMLVLCIFALVSAIAGELMLAGFFIMFAFIVVGLSSFPMPKIGQPAVVVKSEDVIRVIKKSKRS